MLIDPKVFRLELDKMDCIDKFGYIILPITKFNIALERSAVDAMPMVRGHWEWDENGMDWNIGAWRCSHCRSKAETWWTADKHNPLRCAGSHFCGNCGANMIEYNGDYKNE